MENDVLLQKVGGRKFIVMLLIIFMCIPSILFLDLPRESVAVLGDIVIYITVAGFSGNAIEYLSKLKIGKSGGEKLRNIMEDDDENVVVPRRRSRN
jgi:hypothetical protein